MRSHSLEFLNKILVRKIHLNREFNHTKSKQRGKLLPNVRDHSETGANHIFKLFK